MNVLVACEFSGVVREAFRRRGHNALSCDLLPADDGSQFHIQGDAIKAAQSRHWDLLIAHPPCTFLCNSGVKHLYRDGRKENGKDRRRWREMNKAADFFWALLYADVPMVAVENPIMHGHAMDIIALPPTQIIQPWQFGHKEMKATCLWLRNLPPLKPTKVIGPPPKDNKDWQRVHRESPGPNRWKARSITYQGIANAMAQQWGGE